MTEDISSLERAFEFEDPAFRRYMGLRNAGDASPSFLVSLSAAMADHEHPLVRYAGGWAAAEAAMFRVQPSKADRKLLFPLAARQEALERAGKTWAEAGPALKGLRQDDTTERDADIWGFEVRAEQALAYIPSMRAAARWFSGVEPKPGAIESAVEQSTAAVKKIGRLLLGQELPSNLPFGITKKGMCLEVVAGLLIQCDRPVRFVVVPASVRQDNNRQPRVRGDLIAISAEPRHAKTLLDVTAHPEPRRRERYPRLALPIRPPDLSLSKVEGPYKTLRALVSPGKQTHYRRHRLEALSRTLIGRLQAYEHNRQYLTL